MKIQGIMFVGIGVCFGIADVVYWIFSGDPTGTTALALSVGMAMLVGYYLLPTQRQVVYYGAAILLLVSAAIYWGCYQIIGRDPSVTLSVILAVLAVIAFVIGLAERARRRGAEEPVLYEDDKDAEIIDGAGEIGFYSPHSWWPLALAASCAVAFVGLPIGWWLVILGGLLSLLSVVGWVFEYYRGEFKH